jgi:hypothetical protein
MRHHVVDRRRRAAAMAVVRAGLLDHRPRKVCAKAAEAEAENGRMNASSSADDRNWNREGVTSTGVGMARRRVAEAEVTCTSSRLLDRKEAVSATWTVREEDRILRPGEMGTADDGSLEAREVLLRSDAADCDSSNDRDACRLCEASVWVRKMRARERERDEKSPTHAVGISRMVYASAANPGNPLLLGGNRHRRLDHRTEEDLVCQVATDCDSWPPKSLST